jgi:hypothetical protein
MKRDWTIPELQEYWTLQPGELNLLTSKNDENRLGLALLLKFFQIEGRFPENKNEIPRKCAPFVAEQIDIPVSAFFKFFDWYYRESWTILPRLQYRGWMHC